PWVTMLLAVPPIAWAPSSAPSHEYWLKFRSSSVPTSVTTPTVQPAAGLWAVTVLPTARLVTATMAADVTRVLRMRSSCVGGRPGDVGHPLGWETGSSTGHWVAS